MRQACRSKHQRQAKRHRRDWIRDKLARPHDRHAARVGTNGGGKHGFWRKVELHHDHESHETGPAQEQAGLDDLHPRGGHHAAESDVDNHQYADQNHGRQIVEPEQKLDQFARADHLRDQVNGDDSQRADSRQDADRPRLQAESRHICKRVFAQIPEPLGDQEHHDRPADEKADRVNEPVKARRINEGRNTQERCCRHIVAGNG